MEIHALSMIAWINKAQIMSQSMIAKYKTPKTL